MRFSKLACTVVLVAVCIGGHAATPTPPAPPTYTIKNVSQSSVPGWATVENNWQQNVAAIQANLRVENDVGRRSLFARAHFFDEKHNLVDTQDHPAQVWTYARNESKSMPEYFKPKQTYPVYFLIGERIRSGKDKWSAAVIVFGGDDEVTAVVYPNTKGKLADYNFPEKSRVREK